MVDRDHVFQALVLEAVGVCGADVPAIERYIRDRIGALDEVDRREVDRDIARVLGFREPDAPPFKPS